MVEIGINNRIILNGSTGVIKYYGPVENTTGVWVGVDWDNADRGKHDGNYQGKRYFKAHSDTSGSFVREQNLDFGTEFFAQVLDKYATDLQQEVENGQKNDGIQWEFVKMNKIYQKQKDIFRLKCIVLSWTKISHINPENTLQNSFKFCSELDLTKTLIGKWSQILNILSVFPILKILHLSDNRIEPLEECTENDLKKLDDSKTTFSRITHLSLNKCWLTEYTSNQLTQIFANLEELYLAENKLTSFSPSPDNHLKLLDLQGNPIGDLKRIKSIIMLPSLEFLNLSSCQLTNIAYDAEENIGGFQCLKTLILQDNPITQWKAVEPLASVQALRKLILKGAPLSGAKGVDSREMIIAKLPQIVDLDRCDISPTARRSAELLFLSRFSMPPVDEEHLNTVKRLKAIYDFPTEPIFDDTDTNKNFASGIKAKRIILAHGDKIVQRTLSLALPIHKVVGLGAKLFNFDPDQLKGVELRRLRFDPNYPPELISRTKDNLLRQFELDDGDTIAFI